MSLPVLVTKLDDLDVHELTQLQNALFDSLCRRFGLPTAAQVVGQTLANVQVRKLEALASSQEPRQREELESHATERASNPPQFLCARRANSDTAEDAGFASVALTESGNVGVSPTGSTSAADGGDTTTDGPFVELGTNGGGKARAHITHNDQGVKSSKWRRAMRRVTEGAAVRMDPWAHRGLDLLPAEHCKRERYDPHTKRWTFDDVLVKMEGKPFANGAMRQCFAMKKQSTFAQFRSWATAGNFVAKQYLKADVADEAYYTDVQLQMDAKLLGEAYNKTEPPKQVDIMQCCLVRFVDRPGQPLYCVENAIEGDYIKYNSNAGFVNAADAVLRNTPQAFSHFTFHHTRGQKLCVDIQGVGDLYTDPQLHTFDGQEYGDGNLGLRGMALFFRSHECNDLCRKLHLPVFDRCKVDEANQGYSSSSSSRSNATFIKLSRSRPEPRRRSTLDLPSPAQAVADSQGPLALDAKARHHVLKQLQQIGQPDVHAHVHLYVARLYAEVVLLPDLQPHEDPDDAFVAGFFHLRHAAMAGLPHALLVLAKMHSGLEPCLAPFAALAKKAAKDSVTVHDPEIALRLIELAAERGVRNAALVAATSYHHGFSLLGAAANGEERDANLPRTSGAAAARWYEKALNMSPGSEADEAELESLVQQLGTRYQLLAEYGKLLLAGDSTDLKPDPARASELLNEAAEEALAAQKGKLSQIYFQLAEEAGALVEDETA